MFLCRKTECQHKKSIEASLMPDFSDQTWNYSCLNIADGICGLLLYFFAAIKSWFTVLQFCESWIDK